MRQVANWFTSGIGPGLSLTLVATMFVALNMDIQAVPRFDGAGYAVLGQAIATGRGYREINDPRTPPHDHFPPGYPIALALVWRCTGRSVMVAHIFSVVCTVVQLCLPGGGFAQCIRPELR